MTARAGHGGNRGLTVPCSFACEFRADEGLVGERRSRESGNRADECCQEEREDNAAAQNEEDNRGAGKEAELPGLGEGASERDGGAEDGADGGRAGAIEEAAGGGITAEAVEAFAAEEDEGERG